MNTNSNRFKLQELIEGKVGCIDPSKLSNHKQSFEKFVVTTDNKEALLNALTEDAGDIFYKGALTYIEAVSAISRGYQSWAIIKLYYAVFYFLRCLFAAHGYGVVKCNGIYTLKIDLGASPVKRDGGKHRGEQVRGDHKTTIYIFEKEFGQSSILLSNKVSDKFVFDWMMSAREGVNYRYAAFSEPEFDFFVSSIKEEGGMLHWISTYLSDPAGSYLFLEQHCCLAVPLFLLKEVRSEFKSRLGLNSPLRDEQYGSLIDLLAGTGLEGSSMFLSLLKD